MTESAIDYLHDKSRSDGDRPFAAVVGYVLPHCPFIAPRDLFEYYRDGVDVPRREDEQPESITTFRRNRDILEPPLSEERIRIARAAYFALCDYVDNLVGRVLDTLEETGLADDTLVVYTSDHGEMAGEHGCWWKQNYYEGSVGVPLVARLPGRIAAGSVRDAVVNLMDLGPTFAEIADTEFDTPIDGNSLWPLLRDDHEPEWENETVSEFVDNMRGDVGPTRMIRSGRWKLWDYGLQSDIPPALFDIEADPGEVNDLSQKPQYEEIRDKLLEKLYADWDPKAVDRECTRKEAMFRSCAEWGKTTGPRLPETEEVTPPDHDDVEIL